MQHICLLLRRQRHLRCCRRQLPMGLIGHCWLRLLLQDIGKLHNSNWCSRLAPCGGLRLAGLLWRLLTCLRPMLHRRLSLRRRLQSRRCGLRPLLRDTGRWHSNNWCSRRLWCHLPCRLAPCTDGCPLLPIPSCSRLAPTSPRCPSGLPVLLPSLR